MWEMVRYQYPTSSLWMTILFCEASQEYITNIRLVLQCFKRISGLQVNMEKSKVAGVDLNENVLATFDGILGCEQEARSIKNLGLSLGANPRAPLFWQPVLEKMATRLGA